MENQLSTNEKKVRRTSIFPSLVSLLAIIILTAGLVVSVSIAVNGFVKYKTVSGGGISATGSASREFKSNMASWSGSFSEMGETTQEAYVKIEHDMEVVQEYLLSAGFLEDEITFQAVSFREVFRSEYNNDGVFIGEYSEGYQITQTVQVSTYFVDVIEKVSREATQLISAGVDFRSAEPFYYYTDLDTLKLEMIKEATQNAKSRIDIIAKNSNSETGSLVNASLGVFQITGYPSSEEFTSSGSFNTRSKWKTASITVKLYYSVK